MRVSPSLWKINFSKNHSGDQMDPPRAILGLKMMKNDFYFILKSSFHSPDI